MKRKKNIKTRRRDFLKSMCALASLSILSSPGRGLSIPSGKKRYNVLFIVSDDMRTDLACYDDPYAITPHFDKLASRGTTFLNAYCQQAVCNPSRASIMTGCRPDTIKVWDLKTHFRKAKPDIVTLPQFFKQNGYHAQSFGKIFHGRGEPSKDEPSWSAPPKYDNTTKRDNYVLPENQPGEENRKMASCECADVADNAYTDGKVCDDSRAFLKKIAKSGRPFFLAAGFRKPHLPCSAPKKYWDIYDPDKLKVAEQKKGKNCPEIALHDFRELRGYIDIPKKGPVPKEKARQLRHAYYACLSFVDAQVGKLLDSLEKCGLAEKTIIVFWADHGFHLGEHSIWCKTSNFELDARVPMIISVPNRKRAGSKTRSLAELVDLYPTLTDLCGLGIPEGLEGKSLRPIIENPSASVKHAAFTQHPRPSHKKIKAMGYTMRTERFRYTEWRDWKTKKLLAMELYDHRTDSAEMNNIAGNMEYKNMVEKLSIRMKENFLTLREKGNK